MAPTTRRPHARPTSAGRSSHASTATVAPGDADQIAAVAVNWHGDTDGASRPSATGVVNQMGTLGVRCAPGTTEPVRLTVEPRHSSSTLWAQTIQVETQVHPYDTETGRLTPVDLPENGIVRAIWTNGGRKVELMVSSWRKRNDDDPSKNYCEIAVAVTPS